MGEIKLIEEKIKNSSGLSETKGLLTDKELVKYVLHESKHYLSIKADDEELILQIMRLLDLRNCSISYSEHLLDVIKDLIPMVSMFKL